jgi:hypothetical protein
MYVLERIKCGGKIETETSADKEKLIRKLYECDSRDIIQPASMPNITGVLVISVNPGRSEGRYLYEMPDIKLPA